MATREAPPAIDRSKVYPLRLIRAQWFPSKRQWLEARKRGLHEVVWYVGREGYANGAELADKMQEIGKKRPYVAAS